MVPNEKINLVIINVALNSSQSGKILKRGRFPPIFEDNKFVYIPIPERDANEYSITYRSLGLGDWVKKPDLAAHYDPEFKTMTYGDYLDTRIRTTNLSKLETGDYLAFFASFQQYSNKKFMKKAGFYIFGFFEIEKIISLANDFDENEVRYNAHYRREEDYDAIIWKGSEQSARLEKAVPLDKNLVYKLFRSKTGERIDFNAKDKNGRPRTEFSIINSLTRSARLISPKRSHYFWDAIRKYNPHLDIFSG